MTRDDEGVFAPSPPGPRDEALAAGESLGRLIEILEPIAPRYRRRVLAAAAAWFGDGAGGTT